MSAIPQNQPPSPSRPAGTPAPAPARPGSAPGQPSPGGAPQVQAVPGTSQAPGQTPGNPNPDQAAAEPHYLNGSMTPAGFAAVGQAGGSVSYDGRPVTGTHQLPVAAAASDPNAVNARRADIARRRADLDSEETALNEAVDRHQQQQQQRQQAGR